MTAASQVLIEHAIHSTVYLCEDGTTTAETETT